MITKSSTIAFGGIASTGEKVRVVGEHVIEGTARDTTYANRDIVEIPLDDITVEQPEIADIRQVVDGKVLAGELTADEIAAILSLYTPWAAGESLNIGDLRTHGSKLYKVVQSHTSQVGWEPDKVPALFVDTAPTGVIPDWAQPTGAHDAYSIGDQVRFNGQVYESKINANVWSPAVYPAGWTLIG